MRWSDLVNNKRSVGASAGARLRDRGAGEQGSAGFEGNCTTSDGSLVAGGLDVPCSETLDDLRL